MNGQPYPAPQKAPPYGIIAGVLFILCALLNIVQVLSLFIQGVYHSMPGYVSIFSLLGIVVTVLLALSMLVPQLKVLMLAGNVLFILLHLFSGSPVSVPTVLEFIGRIGMCALVVLALVRSPQTAKVAKVIWVIPPVLIILSGVISFVLYAWNVIPMLRPGAFPMLFTLLRVGLQRVLPCLGMLFAAMALAAACGQGQRPA